MDPRFPNLIELCEYCRQNKWPRLPQWQHWIYARKPIALECIKKVGGRYLIDLEAFENYVKKASLDEDESTDENFIKKDFFDEEDTLGK